MTNCLVTLNSAGLDGAGLSFNVDAAPVMSNCTIANNFVIDFKGSGGGVSCYDAFAEITDSILYNNVAGYGPEIAVGDPLEISNPPAGVEVTYSDVLGGEELVHVSTGCTLNWDANNLDTDPLFTSGYYLSNTEAGDDIDSPCVDAGSDTSEAKGLNRYTTRADFAPDEDIVDMGYHYALQRILCDCDFDGNVDISDLTIMFSYWLEGLCELSYGCEGADADLDNDVDLVDFATCANVYAPVDEAPPTPNPSLWETEPGTYPELPGSVLMRAATSTDQNGVEYRFVCTGGGCRNSGWQNTVLYVDKNLPPGTYTYKCQARDKSPQQNRTAWSEEVSATLVIVK